MLCAYKTVDSSSSVVVEIKTFDYVMRLWCLNDTYLLHYMYLRTYFCMEDVV